MNAPDQPTEAPIETGTDDLLGRRVGAVAILTFNRPERRNALSGGMYTGFANALPAIAAGSGHPGADAHRSRQRLLRRW